MDFQESFFQQDALSCFGHCFSAFGTSSESSKLNSSIASEHLWDKFDDFRFDWQSLSDHDLYDLFINDVLADMKSSSHDELFNLLINNPADAKEIVTPIQSMEVEKSSEVALLRPHRYLMWSSQYPDGTPSIKPAIVPIHQLLDTSETGNEDTDVELNFEMSEILFDTPSSQEPSSQEPSSQEPSSLEPSSPEPSSQEPAYEEINNTNCIVQSSTASDEDEEIDVVSLDNPVDFGDRFVVSPPRRDSTKKGKHVWKSSSAVSPRGGKDWGRRSQHNVMERERRNELKAKFEKLRLLVPNVAHFPKASKQMIIDWTATHISKQRMETKRLLQEKDYLQRKLEQINRKKLREI